MQQTAYPCPYFLHISIYFLTSNTSKEFDQKLRKPIPYPGHILRHRRFSSFSQSSIHQLKLRSNMPAKTKVGKPAQFAYLAHNGHY